MRYATQDTDAIGSCRLPAVCCGVVGFKGTYGLINPKGNLDGEQDPGAMIPWFSYPGTTTRDIEDSALVLDVLAETRRETLQSRNSQMRSFRTNSSREWLIP